MPFYPWQVRVCVRACMQVCVCFARCSFHLPVSLSFLPAELYPSLWRYKLVKCTNTLEIIQQFSSSGFVSVGTSVPWQPLTSLANDASLYSVKQTDRLHSHTHTHTHLYRNWHKCVQEQLKTGSFEKTYSISCLYVCVCVCARKEG